MTQDFTWNTMSSALLSNGTFDYLYGSNGNVPITQIDNGDSVTGELVMDQSSNVKGVVEVSSGAAHPYVLANYVDYDTYGNPMTKSGGSVEAGGLTVNGISGDADSAGSYGFGGGYTDATGLAYLVHRYYSTQFGQFLSQDPAISSTGEPFAYAGDDPLASGDPIGMNTIGFCGAAGASWGLQWPGYSPSIGGGAWQLCLARTVNTPKHNDDIGFLTSKFKADNILGFTDGVSLTAFISNSNWLDHLKGKFRYLSLQGIGFPPYGISGALSLLLLAAQWNPVHVRA
jgi:RHS repeat-associated protein